jgi:hypothetical protein
MWHGEAFYGLGVQGVEVLIFLGALFLPSVVSVSQQGFGLRAHTFWFCTLVAILDPPLCPFLNKVICFLAIEMSS